MFFLTRYKYINFIWQNQICVKLLKKKTDRMIVQSVLYVNYSYETHYTVYEILINLLFNSCIP